MGFVFVLAIGSGFTKSWTFLRLCVFMSIYSFLSVLLKYISGCVVVLSSGCFIFSMLNIYIPYYIIYNKNSLLGFIV